MMRPGIELRPTTLSGWTLTHCTTKRDLHCLLVLLHQLVGELAQHFQEGDIDWRLASIPPVRSHGQTEYDAFTETQTTLR